MAKKKKQPSMFPGSDKPKKTSGRAKAAMDKLRKANKPKSAKGKYPPNAPGTR